jgi:hypothetical protein
MAPEKRAMTVQETIKACGPRGAVREATNGDDVSPPTQQVSSGSSPSAGSMSYRSTQLRSPLTELGCTGLSMRRPAFPNPGRGAPIVAKPNLIMVGRPARQRARHLFLAHQRHDSYCLSKLALTRYAVAAQKFRKTASTPTGALRPHLQGDFGMR